jgi:hypothetical protein
MKFVEEGQDGKKERGKDEKKPKKSGFTSFFKFDTFGRQQ